jgi:GNAT superfamily N-acetyltransferase
MATLGSTDREERLRATRSPAALPLPTVRLLEPHDVPAAATVLARAFAEEPAKHALFGSDGPGRAPFRDEAARTGFAEAVARGRLRAAARYAAVHVAEVEGSVAGVAMWYPPGAQPGGLPGGALLHALTAPGTRVLTLIASVSAALWRDRATLRRLLAGRNAAAKQAARGPSWYLAVLGTDPDHRGRGLARLLLERTLDRCDVEGLPAWLETTEEATTGLYVRFGFETVAAIDGGTVLPGLWVMRREPQPDRR